MKNKYWKYEEYKEWRKEQRVSIDIRDELIDELMNALEPLANLDLTGVTGDTVYQRNDTKIMTQDVLTARKLLHPNATNNNVMD